MSVNEFQSFNWTRDEKSDTPLAFQHLHTELLRFGVQFGPQHFKIVDIHSGNSTLNVNDEKIGKISGGTDLAILPFAVSSSSMASGFCVLFELKTTTVYTDISQRGKIVGQALLELICGRFLSEQPSILVILTDLCTGALVYSLAQRDAVEEFLIEEYDLSLSQMADLVVEFLSSKHVRKRCRNLTVQDNEPETTVARTFKKLYSTPMSSLAWEHYLEEVEFTQPWSNDRRAIVANLLLSCGVENLPVLCNPAVGMFS